jgi:hypothetical protein
MVSNSPKEITQNLLWPIALYHLAEKATKTEQHKVLFLGFLYGSTNFKVEPKDALM